MTSQRIREFFPRVVLNTGNSTTNLANAGGLNPFPHLSPHAYLPLRQSPRLPTNLISKIHWPRGISTRNKRQLPRGIANQHACQVVAAKDLLYLLVGGAVELVGVDGLELGAAVADEVKEEEEDGVCLGGCMRG